MCVFAYFTHVKAYLLDTTVLDTDCAHGFLLLYLWLRAARVRTGSFATRTNTHTHTDIQTHTHIYPLFLAFIPTPPTQISRLSFSLLITHMQS